MHLTPINNLIVLIGSLIVLISAAELEERKRSKRQYIQSCPTPCFQCAPALQCQAAYPQFTCNNVCCCPTPTLKGACDGDDSVAACLNGYFCNKRAGNYCCRCPTGQTIGTCVNNKCPVGFACNTNYYCKKEKQTSSNEQFKGCAVGQNAVGGPCVNGQCPAGFTCGVGNICYLSTGEGNLTTTAAGALPATNAFAGTTNTINNPVAQLARMRQALLEPAPTSSGLSGFQLAAEKNTFGAYPRNALHANQDGLLPVEAYLQQPTNNFAGFGSSTSFSSWNQSPMINPLLSSLSGVYSSFNGAKTKH
ncbi:hypothetical protein M3Y98_00162000 [Aphelenchoides besseyi]|nr:hypothetical protein M3Y98_00162000 [Aphelenchoides besseyi]KAI6199918.1 hypothetical protein M3Y96_00678300 [Aphelenchoides besseyi]